MKKLFAVMPALSATLLSTPGAAARTAAELERVLALPAVSYGGTVWFVPGAAEAPLTLLRTLTPTVRYSIINMLYCLLSQGDSMNTKSLYQKNSSMIGFTRANFTFTDILDYSLTGKDGFQTSLADFTSQALYTGASWNFADGTGDWKFISGYEYPVLSWQTRPPAAN